MFLNVNFPLVDIQRRPYCHSMRPTFVCICFRVFMCVFGKTKNCRLFCSCSKKLRENFLMNFDYFFLLFRRCCWTRINLFVQWIMNRTSGICLPADGPEAVCLPSTRERPRRIPWNGRTTGCIERRNSGIPSMHCKVRFNFYEGMNYSSHHMRSIFYRYVPRLIDWLIKYAVLKLIDWLIDGLIGLIDWLIVISL